MARGGPTPLAPPEAGPVFTGSARKLGWSSYYDADSREMILDLRCR
jgi:hypothetical protein